MELISAFLKKYRKKNLKDNYNHSYCGIMVVFLGSKIVCAM